jgi:hypothetical protein
MKNRNDTDKLLSCYYGKPKQFVQTATKSIVVSQQFDDGSPLVLTYGVSAFEEPFGFSQERKYVEDFSESEGGFDRSENDYVKDLGDNDYIENFDDSGESTNRYETGKQDKPRPVTSKSLADDELMADIHSIMAGEKRYDETAKQVVPDPQPAISPATKNSSAESLFSDKKDEHRIFDKLAQSMRYANAYDLGSISMQNRFDEFDRGADLAETNRSEPDPYGVTYYDDDSAGSGRNTTEPLTYEKADTTDFMEDLDILSRQKTVDWTTIRDEIVAKGMAEYDAWCKTKKPDGTCKERYLEEDDLMESRILGYWNRTKDEMVDSMLGDLKDDTKKGDCSEVRFNEAKAKYSSKKVSDLTESEKTELFNLALCQFPWSSVFVSSVIHEALKVHGQEKLFTRRWAHSKYLIDAMNNRSNGKPIQAYKIDLADIEPGDIIIKNRGTSAIDEKWHQVKDGKLILDTGKISGKLTHGDIVIEVDKTNKKVKALGGNTSDKSTGVRGQTVGINEFALNSSNRINYSGEKGGHFAIIKMQS